MQKKAISKPDIPRPKQLNSPESRVSRIVKNILPTHGLLYYYGGFDAPPGVPADLKAEWEEQNAYYHEVPTGYGTSFSINNTKTGEKLDIESPSLISIFALVDFLERQKKGKYSLPIIFIGYSIKFNGHQEKIERKKTRLQPKLLGMFTRKPIEVVIEEEVFVRDGARIMTMRDVAERNPDLMKKLPENIAEERALTIKLLTYAKGDKGSIRQHNLTIILPEKSGGLELAELLSVRPELIVPLMSNFYPNYRETISFPWDYFAQDAYVTLVALDADNSLKLATKMKGEKFWTYFDYLSLIDPSRRTIINSEVEIMNFLAIKKISMSKNDLLKRQ